MELVPPNPRRVERRKLDQLLAGNAEKYFVAGDEIPEDTAVKKKERRECLKGLEMVQGVGEWMVREIDRIACLAMYNPGDSITNKKEGGGAMYVVVRGRVILYSVDHPLLPSTLTRGCSLNEMELTHNTPRSSHTIADTNVALLVITRAAFQSLVSSVSPPRRALLKARSARLFTLHLYRYLSHKVPLFHGIDSSHNEFFFSEISHMMVMKSYEKGEWITTTGNLVYVTRGRLEAFKHRGSSILHEGSHYGEESLLIDTPAKPMLAHRYTEAYVLTRDAILRVLGDSKLSHHSTVISTRARELFSVSIVHSLKNLEIFADLPDKNVERISSCLRIKQLQQGDVVKERHRKYDDMVMVLTGRLRYDSDGGSSFLKEGNAADQLSTNFTLPVVGTLRAEVDSQVLLLSRSQCTDLAAADPLVKANFQSTGVKLFNTTVIKPCLRNVPLFSPFPDEVFDSLAAALVSTCYKAGETILADGDELLFFVVLNGCVRVENALCAPITLRDAECFGGLSVMLPHPRCVSVVAVTDVELMCISPAEFSRLMASERAAYIPRAQVCFRNEVLDRILLSIDGFSSSSSTFRQSLMDSMMEERVEKDEFLFTEGSDQASVFLVVIRGSLTVHKNGEKTGSLCDACSYGVLALLNDTPRTCSIVAATESLVYKLWKKDFDSLSGKEEVRRKLQTKFVSDVLDVCVKAVLVFAHLSDASRGLVVAKLKQMSCTPEQQLMHPSFVSEGKLYFISRGKLSAQVKGYPDSKLHEGCHYGEVTLFYDVPRTTIVISETSSLLYTLSKDDLKALIPLFTEAERDTMFQRAEQEYQLSIATLLKNVSLFQKTSLDVLVLLTNKLVSRVFPKGTQIIKEGEGGTDLFFVSRGLVGVYVLGYQVLQLVDGDYFGEVALVHNTPRTATIVAEQESQVLMLSRESFDDIVERYPTQRDEILTTAESRLRKFVLNELVKKVPMFGSDCSDAFMKRVVECLVPRKYQCGEYVIREGEGGDEMYFVSRGDLTVTIEGKEVHTMTDGGFLGEVALVYDIPRTATIQAASSLQLFVLSKSDFMAVLTDYPDESGSILYTAEKRLQTFVLDELVRKVPMFTGSSDLFIKEIVNKLKPARLQAGDMVIKEGDSTEKNCMYFVSRGDLNVISEGSIVHVMKDGDFFGEVALIYDTPRTASIKAASSALLFMLTQEDFVAVSKWFEDEMQGLRAIAETRFRTIINIMVQKIPLFRNVHSDSFMSEVSLKLTVKGYNKDTCVMREGEGGHEMYFVLRGSLSVTVDNALVRNMYDGNFFGEIALVYDTPRTATIRATLPSTLLVLTQEDFKSVLCKYPEIKDTVMETATARFQVFVLLELIKKVSLFHGVDNDFMRELAHVLIPLTFAAGESVIKEGMKGGEMYFVNRGLLQVSVGNEKVKRVSDGEYFGEVALVYDTTRTAGVHAIEKSHLFMLQRSDFNSVLSQHPSVSVAIFHVAQERFFRFVLLDLVNKVSMFQGSHSNFLSDLVLRLTPKSYYPGDLVIEEGGGGQEMFFISKGTLEILYAGTVVRTLNDGDFFGEVALIYDTPRTATIKAATMAQLYVLTRSDLEEVMIAYPLEANHIHEEAKARLKQFVLADLCKKVPIFSSTDNELIDDLVTKMEPVYYEEDEHVIKEGEGGDEMYFVSRGVLMVFMGTEEVCQLKDGDFFGEIALMFDTPRTATIKARVRSMLFVLSKFDFQAVMDRHDKAAEPIRRIAKQRLQKYVLQENVSKVPLFARCRDNDEFLGAVVEHLTVCTFEEGSFVINENAGGAEMYFISRGSLAVYIGCKLVTTLVDGGFFGEVALLYDTPRIASIKALTRSHLFVFTKENFDKVMERFPLQAESIKQIGQIRFRKFVLEDMVKKVPLFTRCKTSELIEEVVEQLEARKYVKGSSVIEEGGGGHEMYFISRGRLHVMVAGKLVHILTDGNFFGEVALLYDTPRTATIVAETDSHLFSLSNREFKNIMERYPLEAAWTKEIATSRFRKHVLQDIVKKVPIFKDSQDEDFLSKVVEQLRPKGFDTGDVIVREGEGGEEMYFISRGELGISINGIEVHTMKDGDFFGEIAIVYNTPRTATITAKTPSQLFVLMKENFSKIMTENEGVAAGVYTIAKQRFTQFLLTDFLRPHSFFHTSSTDFITELICKLSTRSYEQGDVIVTEGEGGDEMYYVSRGHLSVHVGGKQVHTMKDGDFFGEIALVYDTPRTATIFAENISNLFVLKRTDFYEVMDAFPADADIIRELAKIRLRRHVLGDIVRKVPMFASSHCEDFIAGLVKCLVPRGLEGDEFVVQEGEGGHEMYFVSRGELSVTVAGTKVHTMKDGDFFGEVALLFDTPRTATIKTTGRSGLFVLTKEDLLELMDEYPQAAQGITETADKRFRKHVLSDLVKNVPLFKTCTEEDFIKEIVELLEPKNYQAGEAVVQEGEGGDEMYFILRGQLTVSLAGKEVHVLRDGGFFGEIVLIYQTPRTATITAATSCMVLTLTRENFSAVMKKYPKLEEEVVALAKERLNAFVLEDIVKKVPLFKGCQEEQFIKDVVRCLDPQRYENGEHVISEGEGGNEMYFVSRGELTVVVEEKKVHTMKDGDFFGEVALIYDTPRTATILACGTSQLFVLGKDDLASVFEKYEQLAAGIKRTAGERLRISVLLPMLKKVPLFAQSSESFINDVMMCLLPRSITKGITLMKQGEGGDEMYFILRGVLSITISGKRIASIKDGSFFGEVALLYDTPRTASIVAHTKGQLYVLMRSSLLKVLQEYPKEAAVMRGIAKLRMTQYLEEIVVKNCLFESASSAFIKDLVNTMTPESYEKGQTIVEEGAGGDTMYFVSRGCLLVSSGEFNGHMRDGDFFGEVALVYDTPRTATITAESKTSLFVLSRAAFSSVISMYPVEGDAILDVARVRMGHFVLNDIVKKVPLFQDCEDTDFILAVVESLVPKGCVEGEVIMKEGEGGDEMYFVSRGELIVTSNGKKLHAMKDGDFFGEVALLFRTPRTATIQAATKSQLFVLKKAAFAELTKRFVTTAESIVEIARARFKLHVLSDLVKNVPLFKNCSDENFIKEIVEFLVPVSYEETETVVQEGEGGDEMYFILRGQLTVSLAGKEVHVLRDGGFFGEIVLIYQTPRTATITAATSCMVLTLTRENFSAVMKKYPKLEEEVVILAKERLNAFVLEDIVKKVPLFKGCQEEQFIKDVVRCLHPQRYENGEHVISEGEGGNEMYFVSRGELTVMVEEKNVHIMKDGDFFGELALIYDTPRTATILACGTSQLFVLGKDDLSCVMERYPVLVEQIKRIAEPRLQSVLRGLLKKVPLFVTCNDDAFLLHCVGLMEPKRFMKKQFIIREGMGGDEMYFVSRGEVSISIAGEEVSVLRDGSFFGEIALLFNTPRTATIMAKSDSTLFALHAKDFEEVMSQHVREAELITAIAKKRFNKFILKDIIQKVPLFAELKNRQFIDAIVDVLEFVLVEMDEFVIEKGDIGDGMYFVSRGELDVIVSDEEFFTIKDGGFFGEIALLYDMPRRASVITVSDCYLFKLGKTAFKRVMKEFSAVHDSIREIGKSRLETFVLRDLVQTVPLFKAMNDEKVLSAVCKMLTLEQIQIGVTVVRKGDPGKAMYFVSYGELEATLGNGKKIPLKPGSFFGEIALLITTGRTASIVTKTYCELYKLSKSDFATLVEVCPVFARLCEEKAKQHILKETLLSGVAGTSRTGVLRFCYNNLFYFNIAKKMKLLHLDTWKPEVAPTVRRKIARDIQLTTKSGIVEQGSWAVVSPTRQIRQDGVSISPRRQPLQSDNQAEGSPKGLPVVPRPV